MFKYKNVMLALFTLFFFSTLIHLLYSCLTMEPWERNLAIICSILLFLLPLAVFLTGKLRRAMPYILLTFYVFSCSIMSVINHSVFYLPLLHACAVICCGFFLSVRLCGYLAVLTELSLIISAVFFLPDNTKDYLSVYLIMCFCYSFSCFAMIIFVYTIRRNSFAERMKNKALTASASRKNAFWAAAAQQMRSSSQRLCDFCEKRLSDNDLPAPLRDKIETIRSDTKHLLLVLNDAENYALIESKSMKAEPMPYSFGALVCDISSTCSALLGKKNVDFNIECQPDIPSVLTGDSEKIAQVVISLFDNAVKYTNRGRIVLSFSSRKTAVGVNLQIQVKDTGIGFTDSAAEKIFTVYTEKRKDGTATHVGLAIVRDLVVLMGGFIQAHREPEGGMRFVATLPQGVRNPTPFAEIKEKEKIRVLLYMKEHSEAERLCSQLEKMGIESKSCFSRAEFGTEKDDPSLTHIFTDYSLYNFDKPIFQILSRRLIIITLCGANEGENVTPKNVRSVRKPFNMALMANILNNVFLDTVIKDSSDCDFDPLVDIHYDDPRH